MPHLLWAVTPAALWGQNQYRTLHTVDAGMTWQDVSPPFKFSGSLPQLAVLDENTALASLANFDAKVTEFFFTSDAGRHWRGWKVPLGVGGIVMQNTQEGSAFGSPGDGGLSHSAYTVLRTQDGGHHWTQVNASAPGYLNYPEQKSGQLPQVGQVRDLKFVDSQRGFLSGVTYQAGQSYLYRTRDGGKHFAEIGSTLPLTQAEQKQVSEWWIPYARGREVRVWVRFAAYDGQGQFKSEHLTTFVSHDGGGHWTRLGTRSTAPGLSVQTVVSADGQHGLSWSAPLTNDGTVGRLHLTRDGGRSWQAIAVPFKYQAATLEFALADARHGWLVTTDRHGTGHELWDTNDGGLTWKRLTIEGAM